jgi:prephenate dehydrogenase
VMKVAIIGAAGRMGRWFTRYFSEKGADVVIYDADLESAKEVIKTHRAKLTENLDEAVSKADIVLISVPIAVTLKVILNVLKVAKNGAVVTEISSFKQHLFSHLTHGYRKDVTILSIHPMFGHGAKNLARHRIIVITLRDAENEWRLARELFPEAELTSASVEEHDAAMATVLSLTHFASLVFAAAIPEDIEQIKRLSGTSFKMQMTLAEAVLQEDPQFLASLQIDSVYASKLIDRLVQESEALSKFIKAQDLEKLATRIRALQNKMKKDSRYGMAYSKMYDVIDILLSDDE